MQHGRLIEGVPLAGGCAPIRRVRIRAKTTAVAEWRGEHRVQAGQGHLSRWCCIPAPRHRPAGSARPKFRETWLGRRSRRGPSQRRPRTCGKRHLLQRAFQPLDGWYAAPWRRLFRAFPRRPCATGADTARHWLAEYPRPGRKLARLAGPPLGPASRRCRSAVQCPAA